MSKSPLIIKYLANSFLGKWNCSGFLPKEKYYIQFEWKFNLEAWIKETCDLS